MIFFRQRDVASLFIILFVASDSGGMEFIMDASKAWMLSDFIGTNKVQFQIPVYQRNYDWSETNCDRLLNDIKSIIDTEEKHFIGTIVFMTAKNSGFSLKQYTIIDGQQRLTTMMLILKALSDLSRKIDEDCYYEIEDSYLHNQHCSEEFKIKLKPIKGDNDQFVSLLQDDYEKIIKDGHIWLNYVRCKKRVEGWINNNISPRQILEGLEKLEMVYIELTKGEDDPQIIFESINSTGLELTNADLIRNFLLMDADNQDELFEKYWLHIEKALKKGIDYTNINLFFVNYIVNKTNSPVTENKLYESFVKLFKYEKFNSESCLKELKYYADIFETFVYDCEDYSPAVRKNLKRIWQLKSTTCYPFLMHVFDDYKQGVIDINVLEKVTHLIFSYLLQRNICGVPSNSLRGFFTYLYARVFKVRENKEKYYEAINKFLCTITSKDAVPNEKEFRKALLKANLYRNTVLCKFVLMDIENGDGKETLALDNLTIEHILPQKLNLEWKNISEEEHAEYVHVLGNLSVSGYNSELSNKSFEEKKKILKENSKAVVLNSDVWDQDEWTIKSIKKRGQRLADVIFNRYRIIPVKDNSIEFEYILKLTMDDIGNVTGKKLVKFNFFEYTYMQDTYGLMLADMIRLLDKYDLNILNRLADENYSYVGGQNSLPRISRDASALHTPKEIRDGIFVDLNLSSKSIMKFIAALLEKYEIPLDRFAIFVVDDDKVNGNT